ncbi:MAG: hypothetical protein OD918_10635 [Gammaproteobacteria bacterium]
MTSPAFAQAVRRVLAAQAALAVMLVAVALVATALHPGMAALPTLGLLRAKAAAFGALLGMLATVLTARSVLQSGKAIARADGSAGFAALPLYAGLLMKLLLVAGGAFAGMVWLQLGPLFVLLGYITMQAGYAWAGGEAR